MLNSESFFDYVLLGWCQTKSIILFYLNPFFVFKN